MFVVFLVFSEKQGLLLYVCRAELSYWNLSEHLLFIMTIITYRLVGFGIFRRSAHSIKMKITVILLVYVYRISCVFRMKGLLVGCSRALNSEKIPPKYPQVTVFLFLTSSRSARLHMPNCMHGSPEDEVSRFRAQIVR